METCDNIILDKEQLNKAIKCMNHCVKCCQLSPVIDNYKRDNHMKTCQERAIKCYIDIFIAKKIYKIINKYHKYLHQFHKILILALNYKKLLLINLLM